MNIVLPDIFKYLALLSGVITVIIGIFGLIGIKDVQIRRIMILSGIILILFGIIIVLAYQCDYPSISILEPINMQQVHRKINVVGKASCFSEASKIVLLIHQDAFEDKLEKWFIHSEPAFIGENGIWKLDNVRIGTTNTSNNSPFEIYAYGISDSAIYNQILKTVVNLNYNGSAIKPSEVVGVHDKINLIFKN